MLKRLLPKLLVSSFATIYPSMWEAVRGRGAPDSRVQPTSRDRSFAQDGRKWAVERHLKVLMGEKTFPSSPRFPHALH